MALGLNEKLKVEGFAIVKGFLTDEDLAEVSSATEKLIRQWQAGEISGEDFRSYVCPQSPKPILYRIHNLENKHPCIKRLIDLAPFKNIVQIVMGRDAIPTAFALIIKMPHYGGKVPYHRDPINVPYGTVYNFSIFLDDSSPENGCFEAVPGSHLLQGGAQFSEERPAGAVFICTRRGDLLIHDVRIIHGSAFSHSDKLRRSVIIEFQ